jgi:Domain of unknown function (DUF4260)
VLFPFLRLTAKKTTTWGSESMASDELGRSSPAVGPPVLWWLRLEGFAVAGLGALLYSRCGASWWLFAALWLTPDLSFLGYLAGSAIGSYCYNAVHSYLLPVALAIIAISFREAALLPYAFIWFNHIGVDRLMGYGLKYPTGFGFTHLKRPER